MHEETTIRLNTELETPVKVIPCPTDLNELATPESQQEARKIFERPGVVIVDGAVDEATVDGLREGLSDQRRKFKDKFNNGLPDSERFKHAYGQAGRRMRELTEKLFGYDLPPKGDRSYRPMITESEPLHFDTYAVPCGTASLMAVLNFDVRPRVWNVGPSFREMCRNHPADVQQILKGLRPGESPSVPLRTAGLNGVGPLRAGTPVHQIEFAPGSVWYANPKTISHQIIYGGGAQFEAWRIDQPSCGCQICVVEELGLSIPNLSRNEPAV